MQLKKSHSRFVARFATLIFVVLSLSACKNEQKLPQEETKDLPEDFVKFYNKFHNDSLFQVAHIEFPLEGYPSGNLKDSTLNGAEFRWTADKWQMHRLATFDGTQFTRTFESPMPIVVNEIIIQKQNGYGTLRRFLKRGDEWHLIFYSDMNRLENRSQPNGGLNIDSGTKKPD
jgi:hypothetical protein